jgi:eukaryotic-like serine/threonine-protein kinase
MSPEPLAGRTLGHYRILEEVGKGGMGVVWRAQDTRLDRIVALKQVHPDLLENADMRRRFLQEARAASAITHPNVCTIHAIEEEEGQLFLVLEFLEGATLKEKGPELARNPKALLDTLIQAAEGLAEAHRRGVVHRDVKSANIWVTPRGQVKLMDFGLAKSIRQAPAASEDAATQELTLTGMTVGTIHYMSPEQALGREVDPRSDIFSLGVVLYETATGRLPFVGVSPVETFDRILHHDPPPPSTANPDLSGEFDRIVMKSLRKDPEERYQTAADLVVDLKALRRSLDSGQHPTSGAMAAASGAFPSAGSGGFAAAGSGAMAAAAAPARRHSTLGSVVLVVSAMLAVVSLTLGAVTLMGKKKEAHAVAPASSRPALAVMMFENRTGETKYNWYGENTADLLRVVLSQLGKVDVISKQRMVDVAREMNAKSDALDPSLATEVARRSGASWLVHGDALLVAGAVVLTAEIVDVTTGRVIGAERVTGVNEENMLDKVDELGRLLGERLKVIA